MEYVSGRSLEEVLRTENGTLPLDTALQVTQELAEALDYAHAQGIVHRDVKPSNIIVAEDGHPKIADFGIAKLNAPDLPQTGQTLGTPAYMSPEQLRGDPVDGRSDLFSLGVILYQLLTGHRPFQGNSTHTISFKVLNRDPVPATGTQRRTLSGTRPRDCSRDCQGPVTAISDRDGNGCGPSGASGKYSALEQQW